MYHSPLGADSECGCALRRALQFVPRNIGQPSGLIARRFAPGPETRDCVQCRERQLASAAPAAILYRHRKVERPASRARTPGHSARHRSTGVPGRVDGMVRYPLDCGGRTKPQWAEKHAHRMTHDIEHHCDRTITGLVSCHQHGSNASYVSMARSSSTSRVVTAPWEWRWRKSTRPRRADTGVPRGFHQQTDDPERRQVHSLADQETKMLAAGFGDAVFEKPVTGGIGDQVARVIE